jgi:tryptophanyl-tRNA synthetase
MERPATDTLVLTGNKPCGALGNYLGTIRPALELARRHRADCFIADYHGLITIPDPDTFNRQTDILAAACLALGLGSERVVFYRQSAILEIFEFMWVLAPPDELRRRVMRTVTDSRKTRSTEGS